MQTEPGRIKPALESYKTSGTGAFGGMMVGGLIGLGFAGSLGVLIGGVIGIVVGNSIEYEDIRKRRESVRRSA